MPWPERNIIDRILAGLVGAVLGAFIVFVVLALNYFTLESPIRLPLIGAAIGGGVGFVAGFFRGDAAVRFLGRLFSGRWGAA